MKKKMSWNCLAAFGLMAICGLSPTLVAHAAISSSAVQPNAKAATVTQLQLSSAQARGRTVVTLLATVTAAGKPVFPGLVLFCDAAYPHCEDAHIVARGQLTAKGTAGAVSIPDGGMRKYKAIFLGTKTYSSSTSGVQTEQIAEKHATTAEMFVDGSKFFARMSSFGVPPVTSRVSFLDASNNDVEASHAYPVHPMLQFERSQLIGFTPPVDTTESYLTNVAVGDFNADGVPDIAVNETIYQGSSNSNAVNILLGNGDGTFAPGQSLSVAAGYPMVTTDFNSDGILDLAVGDPTNGEIYIYTGAGDGTFRLTSLAPMFRLNTYGYYPYLQLATADFNGDGFPDLVWTSSDFGGVLLGKGDGTLQAPPSASLTIGSFPGFAATGDFNHDGIADLAIENLPYDDTGKEVPGSIAILLGKGDGTFLTEPPLEAASPQTLNIQDLNGDGIPDIAVANAIFTNPNYLSWIDTFLGKGDGTFTQGPTTALSDRPTNLAFADMNGDGIADVAIQYAAHVGLWTLLGNGDGTFSPGTQSYLPKYVTLYAATGLTGEGLPDLVLGQAPKSNANTNMLAIYRPKYSTLGTADVATVPGGGTHRVFADFAGDATHSGSRSGTVAVPGTKIATTTALTISPGNTVPSGTTLQFTAAVAPGNDANYKAGGTVTFYSGGNTALGTAPLIDGQAVLSYTFSIPQQYPISAVYSGDTNFAGSGSSSVLLTLY